MGIFYAIRKKVIVHTKTNKSFRGILWERNSQFVVLKNAELLSKEIIPMDGEMFIFREDVDFIQVLAV